MFKILVSAPEMISVYALGILCALFFIASGIMTVVTRNTKLISKKSQYNDEIKFCLFYGLVELIGSSLVLIFLILSLIITSQQTLFFVLTAIDAITMVILMFLLDIKFKKK